MAAKRCLVRRLAQLANDGPPDVGGDRGRRQRAYTPLGLGSCLQERDAQLTKLGADLEVEIPDYCVGIDEDRVDQQGWQVDDPHVVGAELEAAFEEALYSSVARGTTEKGVLADSSEGER